MIRLADLYGYTPKQLIERFHIILDEADQKLAGSLPGHLQQLNVYHANTSSALRIECLELLAEKMCKGRLPIMGMAVFRSPTKYASRHSSLYWQGLDIPRFFVRKDSIPICPKCFQESEKAFVPFYWHLHLVRVCPLHGCKLIAVCPDCSHDLNYIRDSNLSGCSCGKKYRDMPIESASAPFINIANKIQDKKTEDFSDENLLYKLSDPHQIFGAMLWYYSYVPERGSSRCLTDETITGCISFFDQWPKNFNNLMEAKIRTAIMLTDRRFSATSLQSVFGNLLIKSRRLPSKALCFNPVLKAIFAYLDYCIHTEGEQSEIGYVLLNGFEVAAILDADAEQVARLVDEGKLRSAKRLKNDAVFNPKRPLFPLKNVFNIWLSRFQSRLSNRHIYLSRW